VCRRAHFKITSDTAERCSAASARYVHASRAEGRRFGRPRCRGTIPMCAANSFSNSAERIRARRFKIGGAAPAMDTLLRTHLSHPLCCNSRVKKSASLQMFKRSQALTTSWCGREDSNLHALRRQPLKLVRLPIPPRPRADRKAGVSLADGARANKPNGQGQKRAIRACARWRAAGSRKRLGSAMMSRGLPDAGGPAKDQQGCACKGCDHRQIGRPSTGS
jgi:hypothetical protein